MLKMESNSGNIRIGNETVKWQTTFDPSVKHKCIGCGYCCEFNTFRNNLVHQSIFNAKSSDVFEIDKYITIGLDVANKLIRSHPSSLKDFA